MATRGRPPGGEHVSVSYTFDKCPGGETRTGWLAGPVHGLPCHCSGPTKPCERELLGPGATCPGCDAGAAREWKGYVPLRRHDGRPFVVLIGESAHPVVHKLAPGSRVCWGRNKGAGESVFVLEWDKGHDWRYYWPTMRPDADLIPWLVRLWRLPHLAAPLRDWFAVECQPAVTPAADPVDVPEYPADAPPALVEIEKRRRSGGGAAGAGPARLGELFDRLPSVNGVHKPT